MVYLCSPGWTRTNDPVVNSHLLYRLSYRGMCLLSYMSSTCYPVVNPDQSGLYRLSYRGMCNASIYLKKRMAGVNDFSLKIWKIMIILS